MKPLPALAVASLICVSLVPAARGEAPGPGMQREVEFLLQAIGTSECEFYRNGSWHGAKTAQEHIGDKYAFLLKLDAIKTTDDFIEKAATKSSLSGEPYKIRCAGSGEETADSWLRDQLARFRSADAQRNQGAPAEAH